MFVPYTPEIEVTMIAFFRRLNERDARHYAAVEAMKLDYGGVTYIASLFGITRDRIYSGIRELDAMRESMIDGGGGGGGNPDLPPTDRVRRPGAGRPRAVGRDPELEHDLLEVVGDGTAGTMRMMRGAAPTEI